MLLDILAWSIIACVVVFLILPVIFGGIDTKYTESIMIGLAFCLFILIPAIVLGASWWAIVRVWG